MVEEINRGWGWEDRIWGDSISKSRSVWIGKRWWWASNCKYFWLIILGKERRMKRFGLTRGSIFIIYYTTTLVFLPQLNPFKQTLPQLQLNSNRLVHKPLSGCRFGFFKQIFKLKSGI